MMQCIMRLYLVYVIDVAASVAVELSVLWLFFPYSYNQMSAELKGPKWKNEH